MWQRCPTCNGTGKIEVYNLYPNYTSISTPNHVTCPTCNGHRIISELNGLPPSPVSLSPKTNFAGMVDIEKELQKREQELKEEILFEIQHLNFFPMTNKELTDELFDKAKQQGSDNDIDLKERTISFVVKMSDDDYIKTVNKLQVILQEESESEKPIEVNKDLERYKYLIERLNTTGRVSLNKEEYKFVQEFEKKLY